MTMATGAAGHTLSTGCMLTTSSSFVMVANHLMSQTVSAFVHRTTSSRPIRPELNDFLAERTGGPKMLTVLAQ